MYCQGLALYLQKMRHPLPEPLFRLFLSSRFLISIPGLPMTFKFFSVAIVAASLFIAGCSDSSTNNASAGAGKAASTPVSIAAITAEAKGFTVGSPMSARTVYVFFDAQCSHCGALWYAAKPLKSQAKFIWIPVGLLNAASTSQGAALLAAGDPATAMDVHEASMMSKGGGISAASDTDAQKEAVKKNTELLTRFGFTSIPTIVGTHAQTGALVSKEGAMPTAELAALLGLQAPSN
jgi:thiol:disulfide interchange protein DsbG